VNPEQPAPDSVPVAPVRKPRLWTVFLTAFLSFAALLLVGIFVPLLVISLSWRLAPGALPYNFQGAMLSLVTNPLGLLVLLLPGQMCILIGGWIPAAISSVPFAQRLGYVRPKIRWWVALLLLPATLFSAVLGELCSRLVSDERSLSLQMFEEISRAYEGWWLVGVVAFLSLTPALCEEALMRGYIQRRLLEHWHPFWAIATSSVLFTALHFDPQHMAGVVPAAIWLGVVAWKTESLWPSMACHAFINAASFTSMHYGGESAHEITSDTFILLGIFGVAAAAALFGLFRRPAPTPGKVAELPPPGESLP